MEIETIKYLMTMCAVHAETDGRRDENFKQFRARYQVQSHFQ